MATQHQIDRLMELAIVQRAELAALVEQIPQLRGHIEEEVGKAIAACKPEIRAELEQHFAGATQAASATLERNIRKMSRAIELSTQAKYNLILAERKANADLAALAEQRIAAAAAELPGKVKSIVTDELSRFPRAGEIDQLRKEFATPVSFNPRGRWAQAIVYQRLDLVTYNGDSFVANETTTERPSRKARSWTLLAARGIGAGGIASLIDLYGQAGSNEILIGNGVDFAKKTLVAGTGIQLNISASQVEIEATGGGIPGSGTVVLVGVTGGSEISVTGGPVTASGTFNLALAATGVGAGVYGDAASVPQLTVDTKGRITAAATVAIAINPDQVVGLDTLDGIVRADGAGNISAVTIGTGLTYVAGTLSATGGGGSSSDSFNVSTNSTGNTTVSTTASRHLEVTNFTGSAGTRIVILSTSGAATGGVILHRMNLPATAAITVEIRNASTVGTLLYTLGTDGSGDDAVAETYFDGAEYQPLRFTYPAL